MNVKSLIWAHRETTAGEMGGREGQRGEWEDKENNYRASEENRKRNRVKIGEKPNLPSGPSVDQK